MRSDACASEAPERGGRAASWPGAGARGGAGAAGACALRGSGGLDARRLPAQRQPGPLGAPEGALCCLRAQPLAAGAPLQCPGAATETAHRAWALSFLSVVSLLIHAGTVPPGSCASSWLVVLAMWCSCMDAQPEGAGLSCRPACGMWRQAQPRPPPTAGTRAWPAQPRSSCPASLPGEGPTMPCTCGMCGCRALPKLLWCALARHAANAQAGAWSGPA